MQALRVFQQIGNIKSQWDKVRIADGWVSLVVEIEQKYKRSKWVVFFKRWSFLASIYTILWLLCYNSHHVVWFNVHNISDGFGQSNRL